MAFVLDCTKWLKNIISSHIYLGQESNLRYYGLTYAGNFEASNKNQKSGLEVIRLKRHHLSEANHGKHLKNRKKQGKKEKKLHQTLKKL